jgi:magnesium transporter
MMHAYREVAGRLERLAPGQDPAAAVWIDLWRPLPEQVAAVGALGVEVPTLADMEEIEVSSRLYREGGLDYMTVVLPGQTDTGEQISAPVTFILGAARLVTVRHHAPRPFETYPTRAERVGPGCAQADQVFLSLVEEIIGRLADLLENAGKGLDAVSRRAMDVEALKRTVLLQSALVQVGREGELIGRVRLALLTLERALGFHLLSYAETKQSSGQRSTLKSLTRDIQALEVHADFLSARVALTTDTTLGMINLSQNTTVRIVSVVAVLFLPPTLIASIYGMNFEVMPELAWVWGYPAAIGLMFAAAAGTWAFFKWRGWL